jgi:hypothetical protein
MPQALGAGIGCYGAPELVITQKNLLRDKKKVQSQRRKTEERTRANGRERERGRETETERGLNVEFVSQFCKYGSF